MSTYHPLAVLLMPKQVTAIVDLPRCPHGFDEPGKGTHILASKSNTDKIGKMDHVGVHYVTG